MGGMSSMSLRLLHSTRLDNTRKELLYSLHDKIDVMRKLKSEEGNKKIRRNPIV